MSKYRTVDPATRLDWMDWAKAFAIFFVVFGHLRSPIMGYMFYFSIPFFFLLSGFLQKKRSFSAELRRSARALLLPYLIYNVYLLVYSIFTGEYNSGYPVNMLLGNQWELSMACRPLWFLLSLFVIRMVYSLSGDRWSAVIAVLCIVGVMLARRFEILKPQGDYFQLWTALICYPFFYLGRLCSKFSLHKCLDGRPEALRIICALVMVALGLFLSTKNGGVNIFRCAPGKVIPLFYFASSLCSFGLMLLIYTLLDIPCGYIRLVSESTLLIFAVHQSILWPMHGLFNGTLWMALGAALLTIAVLSGLAWLARKYCPVLLGK